MEKIEAAGGIGAGENFNEFIADAFGGDDFGVGGESAEGFPGGGFDGKAELYGEADGAEEAEAVFGKAGEGIADGADLFGSEIGLALNVVEEFIFEGIKNMPLMVKSRRWASSWAVVKVMEEGRRPSR